MNLTFLLASALIERVRKMNRVAAGPFKGARTTESARLHDWNQLMGIYEFYLHDVIEDALLSDPPLCIDVGAAEGYYTLGLAHRLPQARHLAYEMLDESRQKLERIAAGGSAAIETRGECTMKSLKADVLGSARGFLIMDCEGCEDSLLTHDLLGPLAGWHVLLEVHDYQAPRAGEKILQLFSPTHQINVVTSREPSATDLAAIAPWPLNVICLDAFRTMFDEGRGSVMRFFYFTPKQ
jgi:hypothetical protein